MFTALYTPPLLWPLGKVQMSGRSEAERIMVKARFELGNDLFLRYLCCLL